MANQTTLILLVVAGALCMVAAALFAVVAWFNFSRAKQPAPAPKGAPKRVMDQAQFDEEEMPTVVVNQPLPGRGPSAPAAPPAGRTSGATIIAFDEEEDDGV